MTDTFPENAAGVIQDAAAEVFETMFFAMVEDEAAESPLGDGVCARVVFEGSWAGSLEIRVPAEEAAAIASDFLGLEFDQAPDRQQIANVIGELANMVCGDALSRLDKAGQFDLRTPQPIKDLNEEEPAVRTALPLAGGPVTVQLYVA